MQRLISLYHHISFEGSIKLNIHEYLKPEFEETAKNYLH